MSWTDSRASLTTLRTSGSVAPRGQPVSMPEVAELRQYRALFVTLLKALTLPGGDEDGLTRSQLGKLGVAGRWGNRG